MFFSYFLLLLNMVGFHVMRSLLINQAQRYKIFNREIDLTLQNFTVRKIADQTEFNQKNDVKIR